MAQLLPQSAPLDPKVALEIAQAGQEMLRKDFYSAAFIIMGAAILGLVAWIIWLQQRLFSVAVHLDKNTDAVEMLLYEVQSRSKRRRTTDAPGKAEGGT